VDVGDAWVLGLGHDPQAMPAVDAVRVPTGTSLDRAHQPRWSAA
jgi:hypothetical protein